MSKLGAHITGGPRDGYGVFAANDPALVVATDEGGALVEAEQLSAGHPVTVFRTHTVYKEAPGDINSKDPAVTWAQFAQYWYDGDAPLTLKEKWQQNPADYYQITNEQGGNDWQSYVNLVDYEREVMKLANADGFKVCILNLAGGSPGDFDIWTDICAPFILEAWQAGNIYGRHVYGDDLVGIDGLPLMGQPMRPIEEMSYLMSLGGRGGLAITECGLDGGYADADQRFYDQMTKYSEALSASDDIIGFAMWNLGNWQTNGTNWQNLTDEFAAYMFENPSPAWKPPDNGGPTPTETLEEHLWSVSLEQQSISLNPDAALQQRIFADSFVPVMSEYWTNWSGNDYAEMAAEHLETGERRVYYAKVPEWNVIKWFTESEPPLPDQWLYPVSDRTKKINSPYGAMRDYDGDGIKDDCHEGIDLLANTGDVVIASRAGNVVWSSNQRRSGGDSAYGEHIIIDHGDGYFSWYCHLVERLVNDGFPVSAGQGIGLAGSTGNSTGPHLHFNIEQFGYSAPPCYVLRQAIDPAPLLGLEPEPPVTGYDLKDYVIGDGRRYYLRNQDGSSQEILQSQVDGGRWYQVKNQAWESFVIDDDWIRRDTDTSPGGGRYYTQREDGVPARWLPRNMDVGDVFSVNLRVQFYMLDDCTQSTSNSGNVTDTRKLTDHFTEWTSKHGITLQDVIQIHWVNGDETYFYCRGYGLVQWERGHNDPNTPAWTAISELVSGGNNERMTGCYS